LGDNHENGNHRDQPVLFGQQQTGQNNLDHKLDALLTNPFGETPEKAMDRCVDEVLSHAYINLSTPEMAPFLFKESIIKRI